MNEPHPSVVALILWGMAAATLGYWLCRRRPWLTLFWVAGSTCLPLLALLAGAEPAGSYRIVASVTLAAGIVIPAMGAVAGGLRFWSAGATMYSARKAGEPADAQGLSPAGSEGPSKELERGRRPRNDA